MSIIKNKITMELKTYLQQHTARSTTDRYLREMNHFFLSFEKNETDPKTATYAQIITYIGERREHFKKSSSLSCVLHAIKHYYAYLVAVGIREDNPAKSIKLKDKQNRDIQTQDLFSSDELELLLQRKERYILLKNRNLLIISLLIYQGLTNQEINQLCVENIDLKQATIDIKASGKNNARTLKLNAKQMYFLMNYLNFDRPKLLSENTTILILSKLGKTDTKEAIHYLIETSKHLFPNKKLNPITIRQSVICNLLKQGNDLRIVQAFAGHKYPSTTEKYKQTKFEELKKQVIKYHSLK